MSFSVLSWGVDAARCRVLPGDPGRSAGAGESIGGTGACSFDSLVEDGSQLSAVGNQFPVQARWRSEASFVCRDEQFFGFPMTDGARLIALRERCHLLRSGDVAREGEDVARCRVSARPGVASR